MKYKVDPKNWLVSLILILGINSLLFSQNCDRYISGNSNHVIQSGEEVCVLPTVEGSITVNEGGVLRFCGQYNLIIQLNVLAGGVLELTSGTSVGIDGTIAIYNNQSDPSIKFVGDVNCPAELYLIEGNSNVQSTLGGSFSVSNESQIYLDNLWFPQGNGGYGSAQNGRIPAQIFVQAPLGAIQYHNNAILRPLFTKLT